MIILDIILTDTDGSRIAYCLANNPSTADIPIVFLTGIIQKGEDIFTGKTSKRYVMAKPVVLENLLSLIEGILLN